MKHFQKQINFVFQLLINYVSINVLSPKKIRNMTIKNNIFNDFLKSKSNQTGSMNLNRTYWYVLLYQILLQWDRQYRQRSFIKTLILRIKCI